jgi:hypothetical protein|tara:strand:- start:17112 stop:17489 length:378 start_codon:yes stop_codon:yes gene_type:complete
MNRRLQITLLMLTLIFQSVQAVALVSSIELSSNQVTEVNSVMDLPPCHQLDQPNTEAADKACDACKGQSQCGTSCVVSCGSAVTGLVSPFQDWLEPLVVFTPQQDSSDNLSGGVYTPIYHPPIRS